MGIFHLNGVVDHRRNSSSNTKGIRMEDKIDKRTKAYRDTVSARETDPADRIEVRMVDTSPTVDPTATKTTFSGDFTAVAPPQDVDRPGFVPAVVVNDFDHCPGCGAELLEDEKSSTCEAHCNKCIYKNY